MINLTKLMATSALAVCLTVGVAGAATLSVGPWSPQGLHNKAGVEFAQGYGAHTPVGATWDPALAPVVGNNPDVSQSPFNSNGLTGTQTYFSVNPTTDGDPAGSAKLSFGDAVQYAFQFLWGSVDSYNYIEFFLGSDSVALFGGDDVAGELGLWPKDNYEIAALVSFVGFENGFDSIQFRSNSSPKDYAFEFALPAPIPLPAGGLLLATALGGLALVRRRKNG